MAALAYADSSPTGRMVRRAVPSPTAVSGSKYNAYKEDYVRRFHQLLHEWKMETVFESSVREKMASPAFAEIVKLGRKVIPLIVQELKIQPSFIFLALHAITKENPVPAAAQGRTDDIIEAWIAWAERTRNDVD